MNKNGYYGDFSSWEEEQREYEKHMQKQAECEQNVVPCFKCGSQMYEQSSQPFENICEECDRANNKQ